MRCGHFIHTVMKLINQHDVAAQCHTKLKKIIFPYIHIYTVTQELTSMSLDNDFNILNKLLLEIVAKIP